MASLRKKYAPDVSTPTPDPPLEVETATDAGPTPPSIEPSPEPVAPQDDAGAALLVQLEAIRQQEVLAQAAQRRNDWVQSSPLAQQHYAALSALHHEAIQSGLVDTSPEYFSYLDGRLADLDAQQPAPASKHFIEEMQARSQALQQATKPVPTRPRAVPVSAPVSREIPSGSGMPRSGRITLTFEQREAARLSGISETEYAKQLLKLRELQASGEYSDRR